MIEASVQEEEGCPVQSDKKLTNEQIVSHSVTFFLAGYETTANTLSYTAYLLALHPVIQEKLQREIDSYLDDNPVSNSPAAIMVTVCIKRKTTVDQAKIMTMIEWCTYSCELWCGFVCFTVNEQIVQDSS